MKIVNLTYLAMGLVVTTLSCTNAPKSDNPFLSPYKTPFGVPPFDQIQVCHFEPAILEGIKRQLVEIEAITSNPEEPNFTNTIAAYDYSGELLDNVSTVLENLSGANTSPELQAVQRKVAPLLSKHRDDINLNPHLFKRIKAVYDKRNELGLNAEQLLLTENVYKVFERGGANLPVDKQEQFRGINQELSLLTLKFSENVLNENNSFKLVIDNPEDLKGLPESVVAMGASDAKAMGLEGKWVYTVQKPSLLPFITYSDRRELREKLYGGYYMRGNNGNANDNKEIVKKIVELRQQRAELLGFPTHAHYTLDRCMAKTPGNVYGLLSKLWAPALKRAIAERADMQKMIKAEGGNFQLGPADWWYYAEKVRKAKYDLDEEMLRPYFPLDGVRKGIFNLTEKLYGLKYVERNDIPKYHPDVQVYEVQEADGKHLGVLYLDFFPRESKDGGAWCTGYRDQRIAPDGQLVTPVVSIVCNFSKPTDGKPALLSYDETETFFHEFGHALHGLFQKITYPGNANVPQDFVELPSQIMEHWAGSPEYLKQYAFHYQTGEAIPDDLINKLERSSVFNQGFGTVEFLAASILDMDYHTLTRDNARIADVITFEKASMDKIGLIPEILPRYRSTYFAHIFSNGGGYSSGYYSYIWAEVLDSDAFEAFKESGNIFSREVAAKFRTCVLERGGTKEAMQMYIDFRGKEPGIEPLLRNRGLN